MWVLLYNGWLDRYWISNPKIVQSLSNVYPMLVQSKSKSKAYPILVQHLLNKMHCCPMIHQIKSRSLVHWTKSWQRLDNSVWTKIGLCLDSKYFHLMRNILWTKPGLTLDLDLFWTIFGLGQTLDCAWTANPIVIEHWITMDSGYMFHVGTRQKLTSKRWQRRHK